MYRLVIQFIAIEYQSASLKCLLAANYNFYVQYCNYLPYFDFRFL
jgi:hypothetical protein